jgi:phenylpropionate dioxygenase-like ring-hydroxylating dioxygenase large terminal subunit
VPQVESSDELIRIKNNPKTNCNAFPTKVINGLLFVWPSADENATLESELTPVVHRAAETNKERLFEGPWNFRELPYGADYFIENVVDPGRIECDRRMVFQKFYFSCLL